MLMGISLLIAGCLLVPGSLLCAFSNSGPQETLGGVLVMTGILCVMVAGLCWWAGL